MIREYALDPEALADHPLPQQFLDFFGQNTGRFVVPLPKTKRWLSQVSQAVQARQHAAPQRSLRQVKAHEALLQGLKQTGQRAFLLERPDVHYDGTRSWLQNALDEHAREPFSDILTNAPGVSGLSPEDASEAHTSWRVTIARQVNRTPTELASAMRPLLQRSKVICFVDPHFTPSKSRFRRALAAYLDWVGVEVQPDLLYVTAFDPASNADNSSSSSTWDDLCFRSLPTLVPAGLTLNVIRLERLTGSDVMHDRYVLTDVAGISVGYGLDCSEEEGMTTTMSLLGTTAWQDNWKKYVDFEGFQVHDTISVVGTGLARVWWRGNSV